MPLASLLRQISAQLPGDSPALDAQVLLAHVTGQNRAWVLSHPEAGLNAAQEQTLVESLARLEGGDPLPYVLGHWEFFWLDFIVTPDVLIPRPETELLIEFALAHARAHPNLACRFIDIGTGSGIIPVTLATRLPTAQFLATDISPAALRIARLNAERHHVADRIRFVECDLLPMVDGGQWTVDSGRWMGSGFTVNRQSSIVNRQSKIVNIITANLPYIPSETLRELPIFGKEPTIALDGGADGLEVIRRLLDRLAAARLGLGRILLEIENRQGAAVAALAREKFPGADIQIKKDLAGRDRLAIVEI